jgi:hypothetical protein
MNLEIFSSWVQACKLREKTFVGLYESNFSSCIMFFVHFDISDLYCDMHANISAVEKPVPAKIFLGSDSSPGRLLVKSSKGTSLGKTAWFGQYVNPKNN